MKLFKKHWERFRAKSVWGKFWDVLLAIIIVLLIIPDGRLMVQRTILKTGLMGGTESNTFEVLNPSALDWELRDLDGKTFTFGELGDRPIFLNHWATWCPPCRAEIPSIISLINQTGKKTHYLLITQEDPQRVKAFLEQNNWDLPVYFPVTPTPSQLTAESLPTTFVVDQNFNIIHKSEGMRDWGSDDAVELVSGD